MSTQENGGSNRAPGRSGKVAVILILAVSLIAYINVTKNGKDLEKKIIEQKNQIQKLERDLLYKDDSLQIAKKEIRALSKRPDRGSFKSGRAGKETNVTAKARK